MRMFRRKKYREKNSAYYCVATLTLFAIQSNRKSMRLNCVPGKCMRTMCEVIEKCFFFVFIFVKCGGADKMCILNLLEL